jgi:hypothetical protein
MRQREQVIGQIKQRQEVERAWATGAKQAFGDYADAATNSAAAAQMLFTDAFKGAEDSLVDFVKSGKLNFSSLADSIITDLTRIAVRQAVLGPLAQALLWRRRRGGHLGELRREHKQFRRGLRRRRRYARRRRGAVCRRRLYLARRRAPGRRARA